MDYSNDFGPVHYFPVGGLKENKYDTNPVTTIYLKLTLPALIMEQSIFMVGMPRNDYIFNPENIK